ncbi:MAG TPA: tetratricopeptide repeat protein [Candidatus Deferrimicrobium sp.]|nr:tetratricopeptide repeat protein [Candidatus Deferrimicrobium sp.]
MRFASFLRRISPAAILALAIGVSQSSADTTYVNVQLVPYGTLTGTATLSGQSNHSGILVYVSGTSIVGATNQTGNYTIIGVPVGTYTLTATKCGYINKIVSGVTILSAGQQVGVSSMALSPDANTESQLFGQAMRKYSYDDFNGAITALRSLITANPSGQYAAASRYRIGLAFSQLEQLDSAIANLTQLISSYPSDSLVPDAYYWRGSYKDQQLNYSGALADFQFVVTNYSGYPIAARAQYRVGQEQEALGNLAQAIAAYLAVETNYPSSPDVPGALYDVGWIYYNQDNYDSAIIQWNKVLTSHPTTAEAAKASHYVGMAYYNQEDFVQALAKFNSSITNYPTGSKLVDSWYYRAQCKYKLESYTYPQAKSDFQYVVTNFASSERAPHARYYLGNCEYELGNASTAITHYQSYIAAEPTNDLVPDAYYKIANAYYFIDADYSNALSAYVTYYTLYPDGKQAGEAHFWAGRCQERLLNNAQAVTEYCTVITQYPNCSSYQDAITRRDGLGVTTCP